MCDVYSPGQVRVLFPHVNFRPKWFVLGGPANGDEAQVFCKEFPGCTALGIEPMRQFREFQKDRDFPGTLVRAGLGETFGPAEITTPVMFKDEIRASFVRHIEGHKQRTWLTTVDTLDKQFGPFEDAVLWLDIEGMELPALKGADETLKRRGSIKLINVEVMPDERPNDLGDIDRFLTNHGFWMIHEWDWQMERRNQIWRLRF